MRSSKISRITKETQIQLELSLDKVAGQTKESQIDIQTGYGFLDHVLELMAFWGRMSLKVQAKGDLHIDPHHTVEDVALALGTALWEALDDRKGIRRIANAKVPMDEALCEVCLDLSGRSWLEWRNDEILPATIANAEKDLWREFYKAFAQNAKCNLHINFLYGKNGHHLIEASAKALGLALYEAISIESDFIPSTKGTLEL